MSDRIAVFNHGRIEQVGAPAEVYERPATQFVAGFVGTSNLLGGDGGRARILGTGRHVHRPPREDPDRATRATPVGDDEYAARRAHPERRLPRPGHPLPSSRSTRARSSSSPSRTWRRPRPRRSPSRGALSASSGNGSTIARSRRRLSPGTTADTEEESTDDAQSRSRAGRGRGARGRGAVAAASGSPTRRSRRLPASVGDGEGALNLVAWAGYVVGGTGGEQVEGYDWVTPFEDGDRLQGHRQGRPGLGQHGPADEDRRVRRRVGVGRRDPPADRRRRRRAGQHSTSSRTTRTCSRASRTSRTTRSTAQAYGVPHGRGANVLMYNTDVVTDDRPTAGASCSTARLAVQGQGHRLRLRDLHRRRGGLPDGDQARPRDHEPVRARRDAVRRPPSTCSSSSKNLIGKYWGTAQERDRRLHERRHGRSGRPGSTRPTSLEAANAADQGASSPRKARPAGPTPG